MLLLNSTENLNQEKKTKKKIKKQKSTKKEKNSNLKQSFWSHLWIEDNCIVGYQHYPVDCTSYHLFLLLCLSNVMMMFITPFTSLGIAKDLVVHSSDFFLFYYPTLFTFVIFGVWTLPVSISICIAVVL